MTNPLCIYHGNCQDGFTAAWAVRKFFGDGEVDFHAGFYDKPPPNITNRDVIIVDFSYKRPILEEMARAAHSIVVLDHHKTAQADLAGLPKPVCPYDPGFEHVHLTTQGLLPLVALFDINRSGAGVTWDYFLLYESRPWLLNHVEDRDLWRFKLPNTREICACLFSYEYDFGIWDTLMFDIMERDGMIDEGRAIMRKQLKDTRELIAEAQQWFEFRGPGNNVRVPVLALPYMMGSEASAMLLEKYPASPFAGYYLDKGDVQYWGLRSRPGFDCSPWALTRGGGGHAQACGFSLPYGDDRLPIRVAGPFL